MPADALDLVTWPALFACLVMGAVFGGLVLWQSPARQRNIGFTTFLAVAYAVVFFTFLTTLRAYTPTQYWGRTIGTGIECAVFGLGIGMGLVLRKTARG